MVGQTVAVFLVLGLLATLLLILRRNGMATFNFALKNRAATARQVEVLERIPLTASHSLHLVKVQNQVMLIGVSPSSCSKIETLADLSHAAKPVEARDE